MGWTSAVVEVLGIICFAAPHLLAWDNQIKTQYLTCTLKCKGVKFEPFK